MALKPIGNRLIIEPQIKPNVTPSGLLLPESAQEKSQIGVVVAVSNGDRDVDVGDLVLFARYRGTEVMVDGRKLLVTSLADMLAIVDNVE